MRCNDPTERETFSSGILCFKCSSGYFSPNFKPASEVKCNWICHVCGAEIADDVLKKDVLDPLNESKNEVIKAVAVDDEDDDDDDNDDDEEKEEGVEDGSDDEDEEEDEVEDFLETLSGLDSLEKWLWNAGQKLHYNHVWILEMEFQLVVAYSRLVENLVGCQSAKTSGLKLRPIRERIVQMTMHLLEVRSLLIEVEIVRCLFNKLIMLFLSSLKVLVHHFEGSRAVHNVR
jgi:hypothetical protein